MFDDDYEVEYDDYEVEYDDYGIDDYSQNMHCDTYGYCGGDSCPNYYKCNQN